MKAEIYRMNLARVQFFQNPMSKFLFIPVVIFLASCSVSNNPIRKDVRRLQRGAITEDTSYVYALPWKKGKAFRLTQGYFGSFTHKERIALDIGMPSGTKVCAARDGVVIRLKEDSDRGGFNKKYRRDANLVVIEHPDGSRSGYWHLQQNGVLVNVGDTVKKGQVIAQSGKTGYSSMPHLHFFVLKPGKSNWQQIPTRFKTARGITYLRPWRKYRNPNQ